MVLIGNRRGDNTPLYRLSLVEILPASKKSTQAQAKAEAKAAHKAQKKTEKTDKKNITADKKAQAAIAQDKQSAPNASAGKVTAEKKTSRRTIFGGGRGK